MDRSQPSSQGYPNDVALAPLHHSEGRLRSFPGQHHQNRTPPHHFPPAKDPLESQSTHSLTEPYSSPVPGQASNQSNPNCSSLGMNHTMPGNQHGPFPGFSTVHRTRSWSNRRPTLVNDDYEPPTQANLLRPPMGTRTYSSAEEGQSKPQEKLSVFSYMWNL